MPAKLSFIFVPHLAKKFKHSQSLNIWAVILTLMSPEEQFLVYLLLLSE